MNTFKRLMAWTFVVISVIGILVCTIGIVGSWLINDELKTTSHNLVSSIEVTIDSVENSLTLASTYLHDANASINMLRETAAQLKEDASENTPILDKLTGEISKSLSPSITKIREVFHSIRERVQAINNAVTALNAFPGIDLPTLSPQMQTLNDRIDEADDNLQQLQKSIADLKSGVIENVSGIILAKVEPIATFLIKLEQELNTYLQLIDRLQAGMADVQSKIDNTIDTITILVTIVLAWIILAQISLLLAARLYLKTGKTIWGTIPDKQEKGESILGPA